MGINFKRGGSQKNKPKTINKMKENGPYNKSEDKKTEKRNNDKKLIELIVSGCPVGSEKKKEGKDKNESKEKKWKDP